MRYRVKLGAKYTVGDKRVPPGTILPPLSKEQVQALEGIIEPVESVLSDRQQPGQFAANDPGEFMDADDEQPPLPPPPPKPAKPVTTPVAPAVVPTAPKATTVAVPAAAPANAPKAPEVKTPEQLINDAKK